MARRLFRDIGSGKFLLLWGISLLSGLSTRMARRLFRDIGSGKFLLLWGISLLSGLSTRMGAGSSLVLHLLSALNDQYYMMYGVLPVFLFVCTCVMEDDAPLVVMRHRTYGRYFFTKWRALAQVSAVLWLGQVGVLLLSGFGQPVVAGWPETGGGLWQEVFALLRQYFSAPELAAFCCAAQLLLGYWLIGFVALWLGHFCSRTLAVKLLMGLYLLAVLCFRLPAMSQPPFLFLTALNHWVLLLHNLTPPWRPVLTALTTGLLAAGMTWSVCRGWRWRLRLPSGGRRGLCPYYRRQLLTRNNLLFLTGLTLLGMGWSWLHGGAPDSSAGWLVRLCGGHGTGYLDPMSFLALLVLEVFPLWPFGVWSTQAMGERCAFLAVRLKRRQELMRAVFHTALLWVLLDSGLLLAAAMAPPLILNLPVDLGLTAVAIGLRILDLSVQLLLILAALCLTGQAVAGFVAVVLMHLLCVLPLPYLPVGLSSLFRLSLPQTGGAVPPLYAAGLLAALAVVLLFWIWGSGVKRLWNQ